MKHNPPDLFLLAVTLALLTIGLIIVSSASAPEALRLTAGANVFLFGLRQLIFAFIGIALMFLMMKFPYTNLKKLSLWLGISSLFFLILVLFVAKDVKGASRWLNLGFMKFQPSEYAKLSAILILAHYFAAIKREINNFMLGVGLPLLFVATICFLILLEPDLGTIIVIFTTFLVMLYVSGARLSHLMLLCLGGLAVVTMLVMLEPYRAKRLVAFIDPWKDPRGDGWQIIQSLYALGSGGPFGMGLGMGRQKFNYLPESHTDYIFSILGEELGLIGTVTVLILFFFIAWRGFKIAISARDRYGRTLAAGITASLVFQAILNIAVVTSSIPVTGITLPFLSYGGSSLLVCLTGVGILLNISKTTSS
ncbi:MAG TPA: putative lipid II flippase FtsW [Bacillota bacterium]